MLALSRACVAVGRNFGEIGSLYRVADVSGARAVIDAEIESIRTMRHALLWAQARSPCALFVNAVTQDEFTIDVIVETGPREFVVFDTT
jgi:hypothetical protein